jgi:hypothetical protein
MSRPWDINPYSGKRHILGWFMWRIAERFPGREIRLPFGRSSWRVDLSQPDPEDE